MMSGGVLTQQVANPAVQTAVLDYFAGERSEMLIAIAAIVVVVAAGLASLMIRDHSSSHILSDGLQSQTFAGGRHRTLSGGAFGPVQTIWRRRPTGGARRHPAGAGRGGRCERTCSFRTAGCRHQQRELCAAGRDRRGARSGCPRGIRHQFLRRWQRGPQRTPLSANGRRTTARPSSTCTRRMANIRHASCTATS